MILKAIYDKKEDIPAGYEALFAERSGKWELTGVEGVKTSADIERLQTALSAERNEHKATKDQLAAFSKLGKKPEELASLGAKVEELELLTKDKDPAAIEQLVETRLKGRMAPLQLKVDELTAQVSEREKQINDWQSKDRQRVISDTIREVATKAGVVPSAIDDAVLHAERLFVVSDDGSVRVRDDATGATPGIDAGTWLSTIKTSRPHWFGVTAGSGAKGGTANSVDNPWSADGWNMTKQGAMLKENRQQAEAFAKAAGTTIGGPRPKPKAKE